MNKKGIIIVFILAIAGILIFMWAAEKTKTAEGLDRENEVTAVEVASPVSKEIASYVTYLGTVMGAKDGSLSFRIAGMLDAVHVREGEQVQKGDLLATLSVPELDAQLKRAESEFKKAQASLKFWEGEVATDSSLYQEGAIAETVLDKTVFNYDQAVSSYQAAKAAVEEVRERKELAYLKAPGSGIIGSIMVREGSNVGPNQPVIFFRQGSPVVYADVVEQDLQKGIKIGTPVIAELDTSAVKGEVERIDFQAKPPFRSVRVFVSFKDRSIASRPSGSGVTLKFEVTSKEKALLVPVSAVDRRSGEPRLLRVNESMKAEAVAVDLGMQIGENRQVQGKLSQQDRFISAGVSNVEPGDSVKIVRSITSNN